MQTIPVIAVIDIGKTNKKLLLFDEDYKLVWERSVQLKEVKDEDGDLCEDLEGLQQTVFSLLHEASIQKTFRIKAINFSTYGASFVYLDEHGKSLTPLYNYLKPYPEKLQKEFYQTYGGETKVSLETASPVLGSLNSGMQLLRIKSENTKLFERIRYALHLPQYISYLFSKKACSDITSIGCHTHLWNFSKNDYHDWVYQEGLQHKFAPIISTDEVQAVSDANGDYLVGTGLHDSSAALIPYFINFQEPFALISTGTWCISLNPFNDLPLTAEELKNDCLCYLSYVGKPVKASRLFSGYEHEQQVKRIASHFNQHPEKYTAMEYDPDLIHKLNLLAGDGGLQNQTAFDDRNLDEFTSDKEAYAQLIFELVQKQIASTNLVLQGTSVKRIFVDGGFSKNSIYMTLLASFYKDKEIYAASMAQATALGAALAIHKHWNKKSLPANLIDLKKYSVIHPVKL